MSEYITLRVIVCSTLLICLLLEGELVGGFFVEYKISFPEI